MSSKETSDQLQTGSDLDVQAVGFVVVPEPIHESLSMKVAAKLLGEKNVLFSQTGMSVPGACLFGRKKVSDIPASQRNSESPLLQRLFFQ